MTRYINHLLAEMESDGLIDWHGKYQNGQRVYIPTEAGIFALGQLIALRSRTDQIGHDLDDRFVRRFLQDAVREYHDIDGSNYED